VREEVSATVGEMGWAAAGSDWEAAGLGWVAAADWGLVVAGLGWAALAGKAAAEMAVLCNSSLTSRRSRCTRKEEAGSEGLVADGEGMAAVAMQQPHFLCPA